MRLKDYGLMFQKWYKREWGKKGVEQEFTLHTCCNGNVEHGNAIKTTIRCYDNNKNMITRRIRETNNTMIAMIAS